jgi:hypothetical protein
MAAILKKIWEKIKEYRFGILSFITFILIELGIHGGGGMF